MEGGAPPQSSVWYKPGGIRPGWVSRESVLVTTLGMLGSMLVFEFAWHFFLPTLSLWQSRGITICFATVIAAALASVMQRRSAAAHSALAAAHAIIEQELEERRGLREMMELLHSISSRTELNTVLHRHLDRLLPGVEGAIYLLSPSRDVAELVASWGLFSDPRGEVETGACWALRLGKAYGSDDGSEVPCQHVGNYAAGRWCFPMLAEGETLGIFHIRPGASSPCITPAQQQRAARLAERVALTLANLRLRETLRNQSIRDTLTGVFNRRYMEESLTRELRRATRLASSISVVMLDLDRFKGLNDAFGHAVGDELLSAFGRFLATHTRAEDIACRYGGEEFVLIFPDTTLQEAVQRVESIRREWADLTVDNHAGGRASTSFSAGIAAFPSDATTADALIRGADGALYRAKAAGRDRILTVNGTTVIAPDPIDCPELAAVSS